MTAHVCVCACAVEVERYLAEDRVDQLCEWQPFNDRFPLSLSAGSNLSPLESILFRWDRMGRRGRAGTGLGWRV